MDIPYLPGREEITGGPLSRFLPPLPLGVLPDWLAENVPTGGWLLDPFGASPQADIEAAAAGYRILTAVNNPITRFTLDVLAAAPRVADFQSILAALADLRWGSERFEVRLQSMYETECPSCGKDIQVRSYLWERGAKTPYARVFTCPYCKDDGEHPITTRDLTLLASIPPDGLYRSRALEKIAVSGDPIREDVGQALESYLPRPLYILFTLINKLEGLSLPPQRRVLTDSAAYLSV